MAVGRPTDYRPEYAKQAKHLCRLGATDVELADFFEVSINTIGNWKARYPAFLGALKAAKEQADQRVERSLYHRAVGYTFDSEKVFQFQGAIVRAATREHVPPDTTAGIFWLKNRKSKEWRDKGDFQLPISADGHAISSIEVHFVTPDPRVIEHEPLNGKNGRG